MTCIVGLEYEGKVYIGGDSCSSNGDRYITSSEDKIFFVETRDDKFLIGGAGTSRGKDILTYNFNPTRANKDDSDDKFMRTIVVDAAKDAFKNCGHESASQGHQRSYNNFLIAYKGHLYKMGSDYAIINYHNTYAVIGSGQEVALGSLWTSRDWKDPKKRIMTALEAAEAVISSVRSPMYIKTL